MACPYDLFTRFLVTKGFDNLVDINKALGSLSLPNVSKDTFLEQQNFVDEMIPLSIKTQIEKQSFSSNFMKWMKELNISELWYGESKWAIDYPSKKSLREEVLDIHKDKTLRVTINGLLIKNMPTRDLVPVLNTKFSSKLKEKQLEFYKKFFFNPERMVRSDWKVYIRNVDSIEKSIYFVALTDDIEALKTKLGISSRINTSDALQFMLNTALTKVKQYALVETPLADKEARAWMTKTTDMIDKYEKYRGADTQDFSKSLQMEFEYIEDVFPTPDKETLEALGEQIAKQDSGVNPDNVTETDDSPDA